MTDNDSDAFFKDKLGVNVSECALILQSYVEGQRQRDPDYQPNVLLTKTLDYAEHFSNCKNKESLERMRRYVISIIYMEVS